MKNILTFLKTFCSINLLTAQEKIENKEYGFSMAHPRKWKVSSEDQAMKNLNLLDFSDAKLIELLKKNNNSISLGTIYKYDIKKHAGLIPTIKINVRINPAEDFDDFKSLITQSSQSFRTLFPDFQYIQQPVEVEISGVKGILFIGKYSIMSKNGQSLKVRSRTYAIPYKKYFFQVNFTDGQVLDDCSNEFDELVKSIKIGNL